MAKDTRRRAGFRILAVVVLTVALFYLARLAGLVMAVQRAEHEEARLAGQVTAMAASAEALETAAAEADSDAAVERWAREEQKWAREGDHLLAPAPEAETADAVSLEDDAGAESAWQRLKRWLGGG